MTLNTCVYIRGPIDGPTAFDLALRAILTVDGSLDRYDTARVVHDSKGSLPEWVQAQLDADPSANVEYWRRRDDRFRTTPGQGLPGSVDCYYMADGTPLEPVDMYERDADEGDDACLLRPACQVEVSWDTVYGYSRHHVQGASGLHAAAIVWLHENLPDGCSLVWQNEFTGGFHEGLDGLTSLAGASVVDPRAWLHNVVLPATTSEAAR